MRKWFTIINNEDLPSSSASIVEGRWFILESLTHYGRGEEKRVFQMAVIRRAKFRSSFVVITSAFQDIPYLFLPGEFPCPSVLEFPSLVSKRNSPFRLAEHVALFPWAVCLTFDSREKWFVSHSLSTAFFSSEWQILLSDCVRSVQTSSKRIIYPSKRLEE